MTRQDFDALCAAQPGATLSGPGELDAWKVGGKMFACFGHTDTRDANTDAVTVKCTDAETATMLIDAGAGHRPKYFPRGWIGLTLAELDPNEAAHRVAVSYDAVASGLTKRVREALR